MPKSKIQLPDRRMIARRIKFKLGNRSSLVSALNVSTDELLKIAADKSAGKKRQVATQVLELRGVTAPVAIKETI